MIFFELFYTFFMIGLFTFGGGYAMIPLIKDSVISKGWLTLNQLTDFIAISESTPGPFAINISTFVGSQVAGFGGAVCATLGVVLPSFVIIIIVAILMNKFIKNRFVQGALKGVRPIVLALILSTVLLLFVRVIFFAGNTFASKNFEFDRSGLALLLMLGGFAFIYKFVKGKSINVLWILLLSGLFGIVIYSI